MNRILLSAMVLLCPLQSLADFSISPELGNHAYPAVCSRAGGFVAVWESSGDDGREISLQVLDADGRPQSSPMRVHQENAGDQQLPDIACRSDSTFLVVWESRGQDGDGLGVFARNFDSDAMPTGNEFQVNTFTADHQRRPRVCVDETGRALIAWESVGQDGDGSGIYARVLATDSTFASDEMLVNRQSEGDQSEPAVACARDERGVVVWKSQGGGAPILARTLSTTGTLGDEISAPFLGGDGASSSHHPSATILESGEYVIAIEQNARIRFSRSTLVSGNTTSTRTVQANRRNEAPVISADSSDNILLAWSRGTGFAFDVAGTRLRTDTDTGDLTILTLNEDRSGNDGAISTTGRGVDIALANDDDGDLVVWQKSDTFADDSASSIWVQRFKNCIGDCSGDRVVRVNELITGVRIALDQAEVADCSTLDSNGSGGVEITEIIRAVGEALAGVCPAPVG